MRCKEFRDHLEEWLEGKLGGEFLARLQNHGLSCVACGALADRARRGSSLLRLMADEPAEPSPGFYTRLRARIREEEDLEQRWAPMESWARRLAWGLLFAIVILAVYLRMTAPQLAAPPPQAQWAMPAAESQDLLAEPATLANLDRDQVMISLVVETGR